MNRDLSTEGIRASVDDGIALLTIDLPGQSANTMSAAFKAELRVVVERLRQATEQAAGLRGVILTSAKKTFFAGGDLRTLIAVRPDQGQSFFDGLQSFKQTLRALERLPIPVAVAINGAALGGGWEICLCAHARFCLDDDKLLLGLPEATLGLLPGAGGVNRMTRLLGLARALPYLIEGRSFSPSQALGMGLLQGIAPDMPAVLAQARRWIDAHPVPCVPWDRDGFVIPKLRHDLDDVMQRWPLRLLAQGQGCYPARQAILAAAVEGACLDIDTALRVETRYLTHLATQQVAKNMIQTFFFEASDIRGGKTRPADVPRIDPRKVALHAGVSGAAALAFSQASRRLCTTLWAAEPHVLDACRASIDALLADAVHRGRMTAERAEAAAGLIGVQVPGEPSWPAGADLVLLGPAQAAAAASEPRDVPHVVVLDESEAATQVPAHLPALRLVGGVTGTLAEIVHGPATSPTALAAAFGYAQVTGRTPVHVRDSGPGYVARLVRAAAQEGAIMRRQGASDALIENACEQTDMARGPLAMAAALDLEMPADLASASSQPAPQLREIQDRMLFIMALEALRCLEDGVVASVAEANIGSIAGAGFPRWTGGALQYIHQYGLERFVAHADRLAASLGERFAPTRLLRELAARGAQRVEVA